MVDFHKHGVWLLAKNVSCVLCMTWPCDHSELEFHSINILKFSILQHADIPPLHCNFSLSLSLSLKQVDQFIHRILVEEEANSCQNGSDEFFHAASDAGQKLYKKDDFSKSQITDVDVYLLRKVLKTTYLYLLYFNQISVI